MDRNTRAKIVWLAEKRELASKSRGRQMGDLGQSGLAILRLLLFRYGDRPCPSYASLKRHSGFCLQTIADALKRLRDAGIVLIERRSIRTRLGARRITNLYLFADSPSLVHRPQKKPIDRIFKDKAFVPFSELRGSLRDALDRLGDAMAERIAHEGSG